jgi:tetratricopeptide (TPR) repeat protein
VKANFIELATRIPDSIERIERNVLTQPTKDIASAWAYLGTIARDFGNMSLAIRLYEKATSLPTCPAEAWLTYVHLFEQIGKPLETLQRIAGFLKKAPALSADNDAYARDVAPLIAEAAEKAAEGGYVLASSFYSINTRLCCGHRHRGRFFFSRPTGCSVAACPSSATRRLDSSLVVALPSPFLVHEHGTVTAAIVPHHPLRRRHITASSVNRQPRS